MFGGKLRSFCMSKIREVRNVVLVLTVPRSVYFTLYTVPLWCIIFTEIYKGQIYDHVGSAYESQPSICTVSLVVPIFQSACFSTTFLIKYEALFLR
ncbi:unnamed protein product [Ixodes persulcatus]